MLKSKTVYEEILMIDTFIQMQVDEYNVGLYFSNNNYPIFEGATANFISEANNRGMPLTGPYSYRHDSARVAGTQNHLHIYCRGGELFALNKDGTAHDQSHGVRIPNKVQTALKDLFPDWTIPTIIEGAPKAVALHFLLHS